MPSTTEVDLSLNREIHDFLHKHAAKEVLEQVCDLVRDCYPDLRAMTFGLRDDPDTEGREWLVIEIQIPRSLACTEELRDRERAFHSRLVTEVPLQQCPLFRLRVHFSSV